MNDNFSIFNQFLQNMNNMTYRNNGAIGALLDEYERALNDLKNVLSTITHTELITIVDEKTTDVDCRSIQTILAHVVRAGYNYVTYIRNDQGESLDFRISMPLDSAAAYKDALDAMFAYNVQLFEDYPNLKLEEYDTSKKMLMRWGQYYDVDQLMEHAIVHILRHRRQIERFLLKMKE